MNLDKKKPNQYEVRNLIRIMILKIDYSDIDCLTLTYKKIKNNHYVLKFKFEIINIYYSSGKIEPLKIQYFSKLDNLFSNKISIKETAYLQSIESNTSIICNCKYNYNNN